MKTLFTFALAGLLATSSFAAGNSEDLIAMSSVNANNKKISVSLKEGVGKAKISIMDMNGRFLNTRNVKAKNDILIPYDLTNLPCGEYQVKITTEDDEVIYTVETKEIVSSEQIIYPLMAYGKKKDYNTVHLTVIGLEEAGVDVKIRSVDGDRIIFEETVDHPEGFQKDYKLTGALVEEVYFDITDVKGRNRKIMF